MKVALVHDWLTGMRGGEKVLEALCEVFPQADIFTLLHIPGSVSGAIEKREIKTSFIQKLPLVKKHYRTFLPLFPAAVERFDFTGYDLVVSTSHCVAKGVITPPGTVHVSYIFTPMRYIWDKYNDYFAPERVGRLKGKALQAIAHYLRIWDVNSSSRVDAFIAISDYVAERVYKYYRRPSTVVYPPVECARFDLSRRWPEDFYLCVSAFAPYKRLDLAVEAFNTLGARLKIAGTGQDEKRLRRMAGPNIEFLGSPADEEISALYSRCKALVFPGEEDFGIVPLEAMASGAPVIAYGKGGALETVVPMNGPDRGSPGPPKAPTGVFFYEQTPGDLVEAVKLFEKNEKVFNPRALRARALEFDTALFKKRIKEEILKLQREHASGEKCLKNTASFLKTSFS